MSAPVWVVWAVWFCGLLVLGRRRGTLRGPETAGRLVAAIALLGAGVVVAIVGVLLEVELCLGSGSECRGVEPVWSPGGAVLAYVGLAMCFVCPAVALLRRRPVGKSRSAPGGN